MLSPGSQHRPCLRVSNGTGRKQVTQTDPPLGSRQSGVHLTHCWRPRHGRCRPRVPWPLAFPARALGPPRSPSLTRARTPTHPHTALFTRPPASQDPSWQRPHGGCTSLHDDPPWPCSLLTAAVPPFLAREASPPLPVFAVCAAEAHPRLPAIRPTFRGEGSGGPQWEGRTTAWDGGRGPSRGSWA